MDWQVDLFKSAVTNRCTEFDFDINFKYASLQRRSVNSAYWIDKSIETLCNDVYEYEFNRMILHCIKSFIMNMEYIL